MCPVQSAQDISPARPWSIARECLALALTLAGLAVAVMLGRASTGTYQDDDIVHFFKAREGWYDAVKAWYNWARPGYNLPTVPVAHFFGFAGCRVFSAVQTAGVAYLAYRIAVLIAPASIRVPPVGGKLRSLSAAVSSRRSGVLCETLAFLAPAMAPALVWLQPLTTTLAITSLTETPAALYLTLGTWLFLRGNRIGACAAVSPIFITRYETLALGLIFLLAILVEWIRAGRDGSGEPPRDTLRGGSPEPPRRGTRWRLAWPVPAIMVLAWAPLAYVLASIIIPLPPELSPLAMFSRSYTGIYGSADLVHYWRGWFIHAAGGGVLALAAAGAVAHFRRAWLPVLLVVGLVGMHMLIYLRGMFESGGYMRFLVPISGLTAALAAGGLGALVRYRGPLPIVAGFLTLALYLNWLTGWDKVTTRLLAWPLADWPAARNFARMDASTDEGLNRWIEIAGQAGMLLMLLLAGAAAVWRGHWARRMLGLVLALLSLRAGWVTARQYVRPLHFNREWVQVAAQEGVAWLDAQPARPTLTGYPVVKFLRDEHVTMCESFDSAAKDFTRSPAGTLFFWDSKYGQDPSRRDNPLRAALKAHGRLVFENSQGDGAVEIYERVVDGQ